MEVQFEVVSCLEKKHYAQWYKHGTRKRFVWVILMGILGVLYLVLGISGGSWFRLLLAAYCIGYSVWLYCRPWSLAKKLIKRDKMYYGTEKVPSVTTFGDSIHDRTQDADITVPYDKITDIYVTNDLIVLTDVKGNAILMDANGFTQGDCQLFLAFIGEKCPQLKLPNW